MSPTTGFLPSHPPLQSFSPRHTAWDRVAAELPQLYRSLMVRSTVQAMPVLAADSTLLPDHELARAATVLGVVAHAYFHQSLSDAPRLPSSIAEPWARVLRRLGRPAEPVLSYQDLIINNWLQRVPGEPRVLQVLQVHDLDLLVPTTGSQEERVFYLTQLEILSRCGPIVGAVARAHDAVSDHDTDLLRDALQLIEQALRSVNRVSLRLIDPRTSAATHVDPVLWAKSVAPLAVPARPGVLGPSGTASPIINLLDAFFGRARHDSQLGHEILAHRSVYPRHWQQFLSAIDGVSVGAALRSHAGGAAARQYQSALEAYAGDDGFLGRHRRKVYGYLAVAFTVGRDLTIGGFAGPPQSRRWNDVDRELRASRAERLPDPTVLQVTHAAGIPVTTDSPASPGGGGLGEVTVAELAGHNDPEHGWWLAVDGTVYDLTGFVAQHPGGAPILQAHAGLDATAAFHRAHRHSGSYIQLRRRYAVGQLRHPPLAGPGSPYWSWVAALCQAVELQNTFRLDRSFLRGTLLNDPSAPAASPFQHDRAHDLHHRFANLYLPALRLQLLLFLAGEGSRPDAAGATDASPEWREAQQPLLREHLDELEQQLATCKQLLAAVLTAATQSMVSGTDPEPSAALNQLQSWLQQETLPDPAATRRLIKIGGD